MLLHDDDDVDEWIGSIGTIRRENCWKRRDSPFRPVGGKTKEKRCNRCNGYGRSRGSDEEESNSRHFNLWAGFAHGDELHAGALQLDIKMILTNVAQQTR